jgi:hypothetical protein
LRVSRWSSFANTIEIWWLHQTVDTRLSSSSCSRRTLCTSAHRNWIVLWIGPMYYNNTMLVDVVPTIVIIVIVVSAATRRPMRQ